MAVTDDCRGKHSNGVHCEPGPGDCPPEVTAPMLWPRTILVTAVLFAFGFFFALPAEDASETAFDESASAFCEITPSLILDPLGKAAEVGGKTFRTRSAQSEDSAAAANKLVDTRSPSMSRQALNQLLRC